MSRWTHEKADTFKFVLSKFSKYTEKKILRCHKTEVLMGACLYGQGGGTCTNMHIPGRLENMSKLYEMGTRILNDTNAESIPVWLKQRNLKNKSFVETLQKKKKKKKPNQKTKEKKQPLFIITQWKQPRSRIYMWSSFYKWVYLSLKDWVRRA